MSRSSCEPLVLIEGHTTDVRGRFIVSGPNYQVVTDGTVGSGGPGQAMGTLDLLVASLVNCTLNDLRGAGDPDTEVVPARPVRLYARVEASEDPERLGNLTIEAIVSGVTHAEAARLIEAYKAHCTVYATLKDVLGVQIVGHGTLIGSNEVTATGTAVDGSNVVPIAALRPDAAI